MASRVVRREQLVGLAEKFSGADLERVVLSDGSARVVKRLPRHGDWLTRTTGGAGRIALLWRSGLLRAVEPVVDHTVIDCEETDGVIAVTMRDAVDDLVPPRVPVSRTSSQALLRGLGRLHATDVGEHIAGLCSIGARYGMFAPALHVHDTAPGSHPLRDRIVGGWPMFFELVPGDVGAAARAIHEDPGPLGRALAQFGDGLLHGDAKLENLGHSRDRTVMIDWGDLTGFGPAEVDVAWYAVKSSARIGVDPDVVFADYEAAAGRRLDPKAMDLACVGSIAQMGFRMASSARLGAPEEPAVGAAQLEWWTRRALAALDSLPY